MDMNEREKRLRQKQAQRRKNVLIMKCIISLLILIVVFQLSICYHRGKIKRILV